MRAWLLNILARWPLGQTVDRWALFGIVGMVLVALWGLILWFAAVQKQRLLDESQRELVHLSSAVAHHTESLFRSVEADLHVIDHWLQVHPETDPLRDASFLELVDQLRRSSGGLVNLRMVSTTGQLYTLPSGDGKALADVSDRPYYKVHLGDSARKLYVGDPALSHDNRKWALPVSWRLDRPVGGMQVVSAAIELEPLMAIHERFRILPAGSVLLIRRDGMVLSRTPFDPNLVGRDVSSSPAFKSALLDRPAGTFTYDGSLSGVSRLVSYEQLSTYPVLVLVSRGVADTLQTYHTRLAVVVASTCLLTMLASWFTFRLGRSQQALRTSKLDQQRLAAELTAAQDASPLGLFRCDAEGRITYVNAAWRRILGLTTEQSPDDWIGLVRPEIRQQVADEWRGAAKQPIMFDAVRRMHRADGSAVLISMKSAPILVEGRFVGRVGTIENITERAANERAQRTLTMIFEATTDFVVQVDRAGRMTYMNPAARRRNGLAPDAPIEHLRFEDFNPPEMVERHRNEMVRTALAQGVWVGETVARDLYGRLTPCSHMLIAHRDKHGRVEHFSAILRDISAAKQAERALRDSEARLRTVTDNVPALISNLDTDLRFRFANQAYMDWLGLQPEQLIGRSLRDIYGDAVLAEIKGHLDAALKGENVSYERELRTLHGKRQVQVSVVPQRDEHGTVNGLFVLISDITLRLVAEQALRQSERRLRSITDRLPMRVSYVDAEERYRFNNLAYQSAFGKRSDELYGLTVQEVLGDDAYRVVQPHIQRALHGETVTFESELTTLEGYSCYRATHIPQFGDDGSTVLGFIAIIEDVTGQKLENRRLIELSQLDSLTGALNRAGFDQRLGEAMARSRSTGTLMALMYLDVDRFKKINDSHGHLIGDMLLKGFAGRISKALRAADIIARLGGDEFTIIVEGLSHRDDVARIAKNVVNAVRLPFVLETQILEITTSIGVALYRGDEDTSVTTLIKRADELLYFAKGEGRNRFRVALVADEENREREERDPRRADSDVD